MVHNYTGTDKQLNQLGFINGVGWKGEKKICIFPFACMKNIPGVGRDSETDEMKNRLSACSDRRSGKLTVSLLKDTAEVKNWLSVCSKIQKKQKTVSLFKETEEVKNWLSVCSKRQKKWKTVHLLSETEEEVENCQLAQRDRRSEKLAVSLLKDTELSLIHISEPTRRA